MNFLEMVVEEKKRLVDRKKKGLSESSLASLTKKRERRHSFHLSFAKRFPDEVKIIAEVKRASPSKGMLAAEDEDISGIIRAYESAGAAALSVLTEQAHFRGSLNDLLRAKELTKLPVLRKDFIVDAYEIYEAAAFGADAVLLIAEALDPGYAEELAALAASIGLDVLLEVHSLASFEKTSHIKGILTGVNSRDLGTLEIDLRHAHDIASAVPEDHPLIIESGINTPSDIELFRDVGACGFLVGTSLMRSRDPAGTMRGLMRSGTHPPGAGA